MNTLLPKSNLQQTHSGDDAYQTLSSLRVTPTINKIKKMSKTRKNKTILLRTNKRYVLEGKLVHLLKFFKPIPFIPLNLSSLSRNQQDLIERAGLKEFFNLKFDPELLRSDLIAELIVSYNPRANVYSRSFVDGLPVKLTRVEMCRVLALPSGRKVKNKIVCGVELISDEDVLFLENVVMKYVALGCEGDGEDQVFEVIRFIKEERRPELVDWGGLVWFMVEKELMKGVELRECYYASHLQLFLRKQRCDLFGAEVGCLGVGDSGVQKLELEISGYGEKESEDRSREVQNDNTCSITGAGKKDETMLNFPVKDGEKQVGGYNDPCVMELGYKTSGILVQRGEEDNVALNMKGTFDDVGNQMENVLAECLAEQGKDELHVMGQGSERVGCCLIQFEQKVNKKQQQEEDEQISLTQGESDNRNVEVGKCLTVYQRKKNGRGKMIGGVGKGQESEMGSGFGLGCAEGGNGVILEELINGENQLDGSIFGQPEGKIEERLEVVDFVGNCNETVFGGEIGDSVVGNSGVDAGNDSKEDHSIEDGCMAELQISGSDDGNTYVMDFEKDEKCEVVCGERTGVNNESGENVDRLSPIQDGNVYSLESECLMKESEDRTEEVQNDNMCFITGAGKKDESMLDFPVEEEVTEKQQQEDEQFSLTQGESDNRNVEVDKGNDEQMLVISDKDDLQGEMNVGVLVEEEGIKMVSAGDDNEKEMEIRQMDSIILEHENSVLENQEKDMYLRSDEKTEMIGQAVLVKHDEAAVDVEARSFGSSGNQLESTNTDLGTDANDSIEVFQHPRLTRCGQVVEVRGEDKIDSTKDMENRENESLFWHCSQNIGAGSDFGSKEAVEIEESPQANVNDYSVVETFVTEASMIDSDFHGNSSNRNSSKTNDFFVEPFASEHNINQNMCGSSVFENPLKSEIDRLNDSHKTPRFEGRPEKKPVNNLNISGVSMFPQKRKMNHIDDGHVRMKNKVQPTECFSDSGSWGEQVNFWLAQAKMIIAAKEDAWRSAQQEEHRLSRNLQQLDNTIHLLKKTKHEELEKRNSKINCLENELFFMGNQIDHYKKALETTRKAFAEFRERHKVPEEPLYVDVPGSGGLVVSRSELEKERLRREQEERYNRLDAMINTFQLHWIDQFEGHKGRMTSLVERLSDVEHGVNDLKNITKVE